MGGGGGGVECATKLRFMCQSFSIVFVDAADTFNLKLL